MLIALSLVVSVLLCQQVMASMGVTGPLLEASHADPCIIRLKNGTYYSFATNHVSNDDTGPFTTHLPPGQYQVPVAKSDSTDLRGSWTELQVDTLPNPGDWTDKTHPYTPQVGSPDVNQLADGTFIMYYAAVPSAQGSDAAKPKHCIGYATSPTILGPYRPVSAPLICNNNTQGTGYIAANLFRDHDDDSLHLLYKRGSAFDPSHTSHVEMRALAPDGHTWAGPPHDILDSLSSEANDAEGPALVRNPFGGYTLFYDAGFFAHEDYRIKYAHSDTLTGAYTERGTLLRTGVYEGVNLTAPGGPDFVGDSNLDMTFMSYSARARLENSGGGKTHIAGARQLHAASLVWHGQFNVTIA